MKARARKIVYGVILLAAAAGITYLFMPAPIDVDIAPVITGPMMVTVDEDGETRAHDRFVVSAPVAGRVSRIELHEGDAVKQGQVVAEVWPLPLSARERDEQMARIASARALKKEADEQVRRAETVHDQAMRERNRVAKLVRDGFVSPQAAEKAIVAEITSSNALDAARFRARAAAAELRAAQAAELAISAKPGSRASVNLESPVSGKVLRIPEKSERVVAAGEPLLIVGDADDLEIVMDFLSTEAVRIRPGMPVLIEGWGGDEPLQAEVRVVEPYAFTKISALGVEEQRVNVIADFIGSHAELADAYRIEARVVIWQADNVLKVPASALFRRQNGWAAFVLEDRRARLRTVETGRRTAYDVEVFAGLQAGEHVILHPSNDISDDTRVRVRETR
ncbi:MAG: efflux RND transporter periplasmic adaptor subunit [Betaproteobacteria bacterium]|jgi:HlyD family secretion protein|nr:MAG: efflux RND transporter periplasmic adaptor subunit [Betaproteobacteria bacterium]